MIGRLAVAAKHARMGQILRAVLVTAIEICQLSMRAVSWVLFPRFRPHPTWTLKQSVLVGVVKAALGYLSTAKPRVHLPLAPGPEGSRFVLIETKRPTLYRGPLRDDTIQPTVVGATWTPQAIEAGAVRKDDVRIILHFHGGAYVLGDGRDRDVGFLARGLLANTSCTHVLAPQYRLASEPLGRYPAALQDALSAYLYLVSDLGVPANQVVLSGDSAGGHIVLGLLRYLAEFGSELDIPTPLAVLLWSPWTNIAASLNARDMMLNERYVTDYIPPSFPAWGARSFLGSGATDLNDPYVSLADEKHVKVGDVPVWVHTGGKEILYDDNRCFVELLRKTDRLVEWVVHEDCPHDIMLMGETLAFEKAAMEGATKAGDFLHRYLSRTT
jgi:acetyl esterase/lipase